MERLRRLRRGWRYHLIMAAVSAFSSAPSIDVRWVRSQTRDSILFPHIFSVFFVFSFFSFSFWPLTVRLRGIKNLKKNKNSSVFLKVQGPSWERFPTQPIYSPDSSLFALILRLADPSCAFGPYHTPFLPFHPTLTAKTQFRSSFVLLRLRDFASPSSSSALANCSLLFLLIPFCASPHP